MWYGCEIGYEIKVIFDNNSSGGFVDSIVFCVCVGYVKRKSEQLKRRTLDIYYFVLII